MASGPNDAREAAMSEGDARDGEMHGQPEDDEGQYVDGATPADDDNDDNDDDDGDDNDDEPGDFADRTQVPPDAVDGHPMPPPRHLNPKMPDLQQGLRFRVDSISSERQRVNRAAPGNPQAKNTRVFRGASTSMLATQDHHYRQVLLATTQAEKARARTCWQNGQDPAHDEVEVITLFGRTEDGLSVYAQLRTELTLVLELPAVYWRETDAARVIECFSVATEIPVARRQWTLLQKHRANGWVPDADDATRPARFPVVTLRLKNYFEYKCALGFFDKNELTIRAVAEDEDRPGQFRRAERQVDCTLTDRNGVEFEVSVWETTEYIKTHQRFSLELGIYPGNWLRLDRCQDLPWHITHCDVQVSTGIDDLRPDPDDQSMGRTVFMSWDIECINCDSAEQRREMQRQGLDKFPNASDPSNAIIMISQTFQLADGRAVRFLHQLGDRVAHETRVVRGREYTVLYFTDELEMLLRFRDLMIHFDPDTLVTYNGDRFDYPYLIARFADRLRCYRGAPPAWGPFLPDFENRTPRGMRFYQWSRFRDDYFSSMACRVAPDRGPQGEELPLVGDEGMRGAGGRRKFPIWVVAAQRGAIITPQLAGRTSADLCTIVRSLGKADKAYMFKNYTLNAVAARCVNEHKVDFGHNDIFDAWHGMMTARRFAEIAGDARAAVDEWLVDLTGHTVQAWVDYDADACIDRLAARKLLGDYCVIDTELPLQIIEKMGIWLFFVQLARVTRCTVHDIINAGQMRRVSSMFIDEAWKQGRFVNLPELFAPYAYQGATVLPPKQGYFGGWHPDDYVDASGNADHGDADHGDDDGRDHGYDGDDDDGGHDDPTPTSEPTTDGGPMAVDPPDGRDATLREQAELLHRSDATRDELVAMLPDGYDWSGFTRDELVQRVALLHVLTLDYKSLYPSIIQELGLCPSTLRDDSQPESRAQRWSRRILKMRADAARRARRRHSVDSADGLDDGPVDGASQPADDDASQPDGLGLGPSGSPVYANERAITREIRQLRLSLQRMEARAVKSPTAVSAGQMAQVKAEIAEYERRLEELRERSADPNIAHGQELANLREHRDVLAARVDELTLPERQSLYRIECRLAQLLGDAPPPRPSHLAELVTLKQVRDALHMVRMRADLDLAQRFHQQAMDKSTYPSRRARESAGARLREAQQMGPLRPEAAEADRKFLEERLRALEKQHEDCKMDLDEDDGDGGGGGGDDDGYGSETVLRDDDESGEVRGLPDEADYVTVCVEAEDGSRRYHKYTRHDPNGIYPIIVRRLLGDRVVYKKRMELEKVLRDELRALLDTETRRRLALAARELGLRDGAPPREQDLQALERLRVELKPLMRDKDARRALVRRWLEGNAWVGADADGLLSRVSMQVKILDGRQLALKVCANSCYGVCGAKVRSPCASCQIAESVTARGRQMIKDSRTCAEVVFERYGCVVVYGDTDSIMVLVKERDPAKAWAIGEEISDHITKVLLGGKVHVLELEEDKLGMALFGKKTYVAYAVEGPDRDGSEIQKGIATVRRDRPEVLNILIRQLIKAMSDLRHLPLYTIARQMLRLCIRHLERLLRGDFPVGDYVICKRINKMGEQTSSHLHMARTMSRRTGQPVLRGDSVNFVYVHRPNEPLASRRVEAPTLLPVTGERVDGLYYLTNQVTNITRKTLRLFLPPEVIDEMFNVYEFAMRNPGVQSVERAFGLAITPAEERERNLCAMLDRAYRRNRLPYRTRLPAPPVKATRTRRKAAPDELAGYQKFWSAMRLAAPVAPVAPGQPSASVASVAPVASVASVAPAKTAKKTRGRKQLSAAERANYENFWSSMTFSPARPGSETASSSKK